MAAYWTSFVSGTIGQASSFVTDMLPILGLLGGLALGERLVRFIIGSARG